MMSVLVIMNVSHINNIVSVCLTHMHAHKDRYFLKHTYVLNQTFVQASIRPTIQNIKRLELYITHCISFWEIGHSYIEHQSNMKNMILKLQEWQAGP
jgi:hypothetical protein